MVAQQTVDLWATCADIKYYSFYANGGTVTGGGIFLDTNGQAIGSFTFSKATTTNFSFETIFAATTTWSTNACPQSMGLQAGTTYGSQVPGQPAGVTYGQTLTVAAILSMSTTTALTYTTGLATGILAGANSPVVGSDFSFGKVN